jgi:hypothetical protein
MANSVVRFALAARTAALPVLLIFTGCISHERPCVPPELNRAQALFQVGETPDQHVPVDAEILATLPHRLEAPERIQPPPMGPPKHALVLSGGGMYGAYAVGILNGWSASGGRPCFDVVTGVSTGALIATYAFLGPEYDHRLFELYTSVHTSDIYRKRTIFSVLWRDAVASSQPLEHLIKDGVTDELLQAVARAHATGRRLYMGTTDLDSGRLVIWDMGAIAASGRPDAKELYCKIVLATSSVPGLLPPVEIPIEINGHKYSQLHVDGGASATLFFRADDFAFPKGATSAERKQLLTGANIYTIVSGKLYTDQNCTKRKTLKIAASSLNAFYSSEVRGELFQMYALCQLGGMHFHLSSIPQDYKFGHESMSFDPAEMKRLYDVGFNLICSNKAWRFDAPVAEPGEYAPPRSGNEFISVEAMAPAAAHASK